MGTPNRREYGFIEGLSLALAHRIEPEAFYMPMTAYFDESGTHGSESPVIIVAGFGATVRQWSSFEKRLKKHFDYFDVGKFHAKDFRQTKGDFKGWPGVKKAGFNSGFLRLIDEKLAFGVAGVVEPSDYKTYYRDKPFPRSVRPDTAYGICFRAALVRSLLDFYDRPDDWPLNVVLELGHPNLPDAARVFQQVKEDAKFPGMLGTISFASKQDCLFLAVADSLVYALFRRTAGYTDHPDKSVVSTGWANPPYWVHRLKMSRTLVDPDGLTALHRIHCDYSAGGRSF